MVCMISRAFETVPTFTSARILKKSRQVPQIDIEKGTVKEALRTRPAV